MSRTLITAAIALTIALPLAGQSAKQVTDDDIRILGKTRAQIEKQFSEKLGAHEGWETRRNKKNTVTLLVRYNRLTRKVEAFSYGNVDFAEPFSDALIERIVKANLPKADWKSVENCLPLYVFYEKFRNTESYTVNVSGNLYPSVS